MDKPWKVISAFVGVFVAGAVFGGFFTLRTSAKRYAAERELLEQLSKSPPAPPVVVESKQVSPTAPVTTAAEQPKAGATAASAQAAQRSQDRIVPAVMREMTRRLNPTADQREKIRVFVSRATDDIQRLSREHWQDTGRVTDRMYEDIEAVLTPEQQVQLRKMKQEALERMRKAKEKQREDAAARSSQARPAANTPGQPARKPASPEGANPGPE